jgi:D-amino peptidase
MLNLVWEALDPRAELIRGYRGRRAGMVEGVDGCQAAMFVGYHARAADGRGVLSHTFTGPDVLWDVLLNGEHASETRFNAALAGEVGAPVLLVTGDDVICEETRSWLPDVETAVVKYALDRYTARCLAPSVAHERIRTAACQGIRKLDSLQPYRLELPIHLEMVFADSSMAAAAATIPGSERRGERGVAYVAPSAQIAHDVCTIALVLAGAVARGERL